MKTLKEEPESRNWIWFKAFEKRLLVNLLKIHDVLIAWRTSLLSAEVWNVSWLWKLFLLKMCSFRIKFAVGQDIKRKLMCWVSARVPKKYLENGFPLCFRDGILLCALIERVVNGACPRYDLLDPDQPLRNLKLALHLVEKHFKIKPPVTAEDIFESDKPAEKRLLLLIAQIKLATERFHLPSVDMKHRKDFMSQTTFVSDKCFARGMGLLLAVRGRKACFTILLDSIENLDMVIEIRGPKNTACNKRITSALSLSRSDSADIRDIVDAQIQEDILKKRIPLEYRILGRKISVNYTPLESGTHNMSIIWQGQHIMGSPYTITVDSSIENPDLWFTPSLKRNYTHLKRSDSQYFDDFIEPKLASCPETAVTRKRILRYIVKIDGNDVIIEGKEDLCQAIINIKKKIKNNLMSHEENSKSNTKDKSEDFSNDEAEEAKVIFERPHKTNNLKMKHNIEMNTADVNKGFSFYQNSNINDNECYLENHIERNVLSDSHKESKSIRDNANSELSQSIEMNVQLQRDSIDMTRKLESENYSLKSQSSKEYNEKDVKVLNGELHEEFYPPQDKSLLKKSNLKFKEANKSNSKSKVTFYDNFREETKSENRNKSPKSLHGDGNEDKGFQNDDVNFFPVHKVDYEILHDEDMEDDIAYNPGRRTSFTELNESNYLDECADKIEQAVNQTGSNSLITNEDIVQNLENAFENYETKDIRNCLRSNFALFQCDHSLSFWGETVTETPPEFIFNENDESELVSSNNVLEEWQNDTSSIRKGGEDFELDKSKLSESDILNNTQKCSPENNQIKSSDSYDQQTPQNDDFNKHKDDFDVIRSLLKETSDKKRLSWTDKDFLPSIRESSVEGALYEEAIFDQLNEGDVKINNSNFKEVENKSQLDIENVTDLSNRAQTHSIFDETAAYSARLEDLKNKSFQSLSDQQQNGTHLTGKAKNSVERISNPTGCLQQSTSAEEATRNKFSSMNILSASPYKSKSEGTKYTEVRFPVTQFEEKSPNVFPNNSSCSLDGHTSYVLTRATPAIIESNNSFTVEQESPEAKRTFKKIHEMKDDNHNIQYEAKSVQCLSVKKVIQIFQKEKEEPLDTWPIETESFKFQVSPQKKFNDDFVRNMTERKFDVPDAENNLLGEISCSSIRDRVKLFEKDDKKKLQSSFEKNKTERRTSSTISAKKNYWENIEF